MGINVKRKAESDETDIAEDGAERPGLKRRGTSVLEQDRSTLALFTNGEASLQQNNSNQHISNENDSTNYNNHYTTTPSSNTSSSNSSNNGIIPHHPMNHSHPFFIQSLQHKLTHFYSTYAHIFGPSYVSDLKTLQWKIASPDPISALLETGSEFLGILDRYLENLQAVAMQQIRLRACMVEIGVEKGVVEAIDQVLGTLDRRIIELGTQSQGLAWELRRAGEDASLSNGLDEGKDDVGMYD